MTQGVQLSIENYNLFLINCFMKITEIRVL